MVIKKQSISNRGFDKLRARCTDMAKPSPLPCRTRIRHGFAADTHGFVLDSCLIVSVVDSW